MTASICLEKTTTKEGEGDSSWMKSERALSKAASASFSLLRAVWAEEKNIAEGEVIQACLAEAGFDPKLADSGLLRGAEVYEANLEEAVGRGVFGAPFYVTEDEQRFWGQDRLADLVRHLAQM